MNSSNLGAGGGVSAPFILEGNPQDIIDAELLRMPNYSQIYLSSPEHPIRGLNVAVGADLTAEDFRKKLRIKSEAKKDGDAKGGRGGGLGGFFNLDDKYEEMNGYVQEHLRKRGIVFKKKDEGSSNDVGVKSGAAPIGEGTASGILSKVGKGKNVKIQAGKHQLVCQRMHSRIPKDKNECFKEPENVDKKEPQENPTSKDEVQVPNDAPTSEDAPVLEKSASADCAVDDKVEEDEEEDLDVIGIFADGNAEELLPPL